MSSVVTLDAARDLRVRTASACRPIEVGLLGCGNVGAAFAALTQQPPRAVPEVRITSALVRDPRRPRPSLRGEALRTDHGEAVFDTKPDVIVELLGGIEPARALVLDALRRRIPVVTANKSLLAAHGAELRSASEGTGTPLLYEAAVIAGVPFLGTFARRPHAARLTTIVGIANGTSNYVLTRAASDRISIETALAEAQRLGLAEPDPTNDVDGVDAAEKLAVLLQHFASVEVAPGAIETGGIRALTEREIEQAADLGGLVKPVIFADWSDGVRAFSGPAFVPADHHLADVNEAENALILGGPHGRVVFGGPGAGPAVTAATVLDDVLEASSRAPTLRTRPLRRGVCGAPQTEWFVSLAAARLPRGADVADLLASYGIFLRRTGPRRSSGGCDHVAALTWPSERGRLEAALAALRAAAGCETVHFRVLEASR